jgi:hypothetical protein
LAGFSVLRLFQIGAVFSGKFGAENRRLTGLNIQRIDKIAVLDSINYLLNMAFGFLSASAREYFDRGPADYRLFSGTVA